MNIELSPELLKEATEKAITAAVTNSLQSYSVRSAIENGVTSSILVSTIDETVNGALQQIDTSALQNAIASEITKTVAKMTAGLIRETGIELIFKLQGHPSYMQDAEIIRHKREIEAKYFDEKISRQSTVVPENKTLETNHVEPF